MAIPWRVQQLLVQRDPYCIHCGETEDLVVHHRRNRQMGGSKKLDRIDNLLRVCAVYNGHMESQPIVANLARDYGHKLASWDDFNTPVFDTTNRTWYVLTETGEKKESDPPGFLI